MKYSRAQMKREVKDDIRQSRPKAIFVTLAFLIAAFLVSLGLYYARRYFPSGEAGAHLWRYFELGKGLLAGDRRPEELIQSVRDTIGAVLATAGISLLLNLEASVFTWTLNYGYQGYCLRMVRREKTGFLRLLCAFPQWGWVLLTQVLIAFFTFLWTIFSTLAAAAATAAIWIFVRPGHPSLSTALMIGVWVIAVLFVGVYIPLRYSMSNYILLDERTDALEAINRSKRLLRGRKFHLLVLRLSFLNWYAAIGAIAGIVAFVTMKLTATDITSAAADPLAFITRITAVSAAATLISRLAVIPLELWLKAYTTGAEAKFFDWMKQADIASDVWESDRQYKAPYLPNRNGTPSPPAEQDAEEADLVPVPDAPEEDMPDLPEERPPRLPEPEEFFVPLSELPVAEPDETEDADIPDEPSEIPAEIPEALDELPETLEEPSDTPDEPSEVPDETEMPDQPPEIPEEPPEEPGPEPDPE